MAADRDTERAQSRSATGRPERSAAQAAEAAHAHKRSSWVVVVLLCVATIILGFAFVLQSLPLGIVGVVIGIIGVVGLFAAGVMDDAY